MFIENIGISRHYYDNELYTNFNVIMYFPDTQ
jgi:hypothetical protein